MKKLVVFFLVFALVLKAQVLISTDSDSLPKILQKGDIKRLGLKEMTLGEPWKCLNYNKIKNTFVVSTLPAGTIVLVDPSGTIFYKADCGNRLLSLDSEENGMGGQRESARKKIEEKNIARELYKQKAETLECITKNSVRQQGYYPGYGVTYYPYYYGYGGYYNYSYPYSGYNRNVWVGTGTRFYPDPPSRGTNGGQRNPGAYHTGRR